MKNVALAIAAVGALIATPVLAADMATKAPPRVVAAPVPFSWTGFYVGLNGGYAQNRIETVGQGLPFVGTSASPTSQDFNTSGGFGGGQLGLNYQWQSIVFGAEADAQLSNVDGNSSLIFTTPIRNGAACGAGCFGNRTYHSNMESFETVRGRLGIAFDRLLVFGTGGWMAARLSESANWLFPTPTATYPASNSRTGSGGVWGGGVEYAYTNNLTFKVEALGYRLGTDTFAANGTGAGVGTGALYQLTTKGWLIRGGVNWKFDWWGYHG